MSDEAKINVATGFQGGSSVALRADTVDEFVALAKSIYGDAGGDVFVQRVFGDLSSSFPEVGAVQNLDNAGLQPTVVPPPTAPAVATGVASVGVSTVGQPLPQPNHAPAAIPPGTDYPGDCAHGPRSYKDSLARGKSWRRWECAVPYQGRDGDNSQRCQAVNV